MKINIPGVKSEIGKNPILEQHNSLGQCVRSEIVNIQYQMNTIVWGNAMILNWKYPILEQHYISGQCVQSEIGNIQ